MSIPKTYIDEMLKNLSSSHIVNLISQTDARRILQEVKETENNFPRFDSLLTEKAIHIAYTLISCGCSLVEHKDSTANDGLLILEKAGKLLSNSLSFNDAENETKDIHILISSMAFYAAKQYSYAFIVLKNVQVDFSIGQLVYNFLRKDFSSLLNNINKVMLISAREEFEQHELSEWIITIEIARIFSITLDFIQSGNEETFKLIYDILDKILYIAYDDNLVSYWLMIRLLKIIFSTYQETSLWSVLPPLLSDKQSTEKYIRLLSNFGNPVIELWPSQTISLPLAVGDNKGVVINLRTSAGKTRIAEISILKTLSTNSSSKILYLAPFRSLAFELEHSLSKTFNPLGINISQLYGGALANTSDFDLINESQIIIATPEKAKALIRCNSGLEKNIKLIIIDEGHLLGDNDRNIRNEMFLIYMNEFATRNNIRILLLSAVIPNADEIAKWIANDKESVAKSDWKPSQERLGLLLWNGSVVRLEWKSNNNPYNPNFIQSKPLGFSRRRNPFPNNKNEAIAATAVKLSSNGTVMIFSARAKSILGLAKNVMDALGEYPIDYLWDKALWDVFESVCQEEIGDNNIILKAARKGVLCHSNDLSQLVRIAIERLMRSKSPLIIIASSTLAQGVNIGISTVIVSTPYYDENTINHCDFWNICGRAGRAFSDFEGKILYAIDTQIRPKNELRKIQKNINLANNYFDKNNMEAVNSGVLIILKDIFQIAQMTGTCFENLLELIANDDISTIDSSKLLEEINKLFFNIDDELLAMHEEYSINDDNFIWIDDVFRKSLALIQAKNENIDDFIEILKARIKAILNRVPQNKDRRRIISSGIPFSVSIIILENISYFYNIAINFIQEINDEKDWVDSLSFIIKELELWSNENASNLMKSVPKESSLDNIRRGWISGTSLIELKQFEDGDSIDDISKNYYGFTLPWIVHAISQIFDPDTDDVIINLYSRIAVYIELGLPNDSAVNIYLAGIRSRCSALELSKLQIFKDKKISEIKNIFYEAIIKTVDISKETKTWIDLLTGIYQSQVKETISFPPLILKHKNLPEKLYPRRIDQECFLVSGDGYYKEIVESTEDFPFDKISNINGLYFILINNEWILKSFNPLIEIIPNY